MCVCLYVYVCVWATTCNAISTLLKLSDRSFLLSVDPTLFSGTDNCISDRMVVLFDRRVLPLAEFERMPFVELLQLADHVMIADHDDCHYLQVCMAKRDDSFISKLVTLSHNVPLCD